MALPLAIPDSPPSRASPASTDASHGPQTPVSPDNAVQTLALPSADGPTPAPSAAPAAPAPAGTQTKRKPSRRANTAERRATHNAVERARRETLNGRFLDLAALLPNLSQIRRPSKSSIVNSSIAHIHAARRHRLLAARELRILKLESDALRRELNEWRDRSGLPRVDEPVRGEAFQMILSGEVEVLNAGPIEEEDANDDYGDDDYTPSAPPPMSALIHEDAQMDLHVPLPKPGDVNPFAHAVPQRGALQLQTILPRPAHQGPHTPMIVQSPTAVSFENPAMAALYEPHHHHIQQPSFTPGGQYVQQAPHMGVHDDKWGAPMFNTQVPGGPAIFTPPASSHGAGNVSPMNVGAPGQQQQQQQQAYLMNLQRQHMMQQQQQQHDGSPSSGPRRERSGSVNSNGSGYASPVSNPGSSYEMPSVMNGGPGAVPRHLAGNGGWDDGMNMGIGGMNMGMMKSTPISVGGGGNGHGYASMML
ncbi:hypothetical protein PYCCODRAFT_1357387 [Trametes coccinea BRFM310]|uniref:BHLH domain-containing protein n=1 Tax=Trametes coccinea (strain BRFM310) TaxID=1353009 RepID=A0A1Y2J7J9_TRAC3|nr:hypothetical protein PYCCODRAFT_1357387 [Trametes coccinea BRFM310]